MIEWRDQGILLATRRHGETSAIIEVFTPTRGRNAGIVRGGGGKKMGPILQPGAQLDVTWRARLDDHLGTFTVEPIKSRAALVLDDRKALAGLSAITAILAFVLPERAAYPALYAKSETLLDMLADNPAWTYAYMLWELSVLDDMGFGLDFSTCAVLGNQNDLSFVSPRTGRAVSRKGAGEWADRLLPLPPCMLGESTSDPAQIALALHTTGHFLKNRLAPQMGNKQLPEARQRLVDLLNRQPGMR